MRKQDIPRIKFLPMTANEKKMWEEYIQARKAKSSARALKAWARKYKVKLRGRNRVQLVKSYRGTNVPASRPNAPREKDCSNICHIRSFSRWEKYDRWKMVTDCILDDCQYSTELKAWICFYKCMTGIRLS